MLDTVYPRLERKKIRRIEKGKHKKFSTVEQANEYTQLFDNVRTYSAMISDNGVLYRSNSNADEFDRLHFTLSDLETLRDSIVDDCCPIVFANLVEAKVAGKKYSYRCKRKSTGTTKGTVNPTHKAEVYIDECSVNVQPNLYAAALANADFARIEDVAMADFANMAVPAGRVFPDAPIQLQEGAVPMANRIARAA